MFVCVYQLAAATVYKSIIQSKRYSCFTMSAVYFTFQHPTSIIIAGPTRSGKTRFVINVLKSCLIQPFPTRIVWLYKEWQPAYDELKLMIPSIEFSHGIDMDKLSEINASEKNLVVLDDLMTNGGDSKQISALFTQESHHRNLTVIFIIQNLFYHGKEMRTITLNAHYLVLYKNPRDKSQIRFLAQQIFPEDSKYLLNVFNHATSAPHSYLVIDLHPETPDDYRLLNNIFPGEQIRLYQPLKL